MDLPYGFERVTATHGLVRVPPEPLKRIFRQIVHTAPNAHLVGIAAHWLFFNSLARVAMPTEWIVVIPRDTMVLHEHHWKTEGFSVEIDRTLIRVRTVQTNLWKAITIPTFSVLQIAISLTQITNWTLESRTAEFLMTEGVLNDITNRMCRIPFPIPEAEEPMYQFLARLGYRFYDWEADRMFQLALRRQTAQLDAMERMK